jgi:hypothetical protein
VEEAAVTRGPLSVACGQCGVDAGEKCVDYRGRGCAPHRTRRQVVEVKRCQEVEAAKKVRVPRDPAQLDLWGKR